MHARAIARALPLAAWALLGCGGTVEFGVTRDSGAATAADAGPTAPDAAAMRPDAAATPDAGACTPRTRPPVPTTWPYPATAASFTTHFLDAIPPGALACSNAACHNGPRPPYIPDAAALATAANVTRAVSEVWQSALPGAGGGPSLLRRRHAADGDRAEPLYLPAQITAIEAFERLAYDCAWKSAPAPGPGECPAPDTAYCNR